MLMWAFGTLGGLSPQEVAEHESVFGALRGLFAALR